MRDVRRQIPHASETLDVLLSDGGGPPLALGTRSRYGCGGWWRRERLRFRALELRGREGIGARRKAWEKEKESLPSYIGGEMPNATPLKP